MNELHKILDSIKISFDLDTLADSISRGKAVVYTGAGTSIPANLPGWEGFLKECLRRAKRSSSAAKKKWLRATKLFEEGDYLTSAGILQREIGQSLEQYVWETFGTAKEPTEIWKSSRVELFDLSRNVGEETNLSKTQPDKARRLHKLMTDFLDEVGAETAKTTDKKKQKDEFSNHSENGTQSDVH